MAAFGWSAGDIAEAIKLVVRVARAFKDVGGAIDQCRQTSNFLSSFEVPLKHLKVHIDSTSSQADQYSADIAQQLQRIQQPWLWFRNVVDRYDASLGEATTNQNLGR